MKDSFGLRLRYYRTNLDLTQQQLADKSGVSRKQISDFEKEIQTNPREQTLKKLAKALEIDVHNLKPDLEMPSDIPEIIKLSLKGESTGNARIVSHELDISNYPDYIIDNIQQEADKNGRTFDEQFNLIIMQLLTKEINREKREKLNNISSELLNSENNYLNFLNKKDK